MPNFDVIRTAHLGIVEYLCKPSPPPELLGCWPLTSTTDKADLSRYGHAYTGSLAAATQTNALAKVIPQQNQAFEFELNLGQPWSVDFFMGVSHGYGGGSSTGLSIGAFNSYLGSLTNQAAITDNISYNGTILATGSAALPAAGSHIAFTYDGTTIRRFINGILNLYADVSMSGTAAGFSLFLNNAWCFGNLRVIQKCLGTTAYSVPTGFYTGYEAL